MQYLLTEEEYAEFQVLKVAPVAEEQRKSSFEQEARFLFEHSRMRVVSEAHLMGRRSLELKIELDRLPVNMRNYLEHIVGG